MFDSQFYLPFPMQGYYVSPAIQYQLMMEEAQQQIQAGLQAQCASTGYPIEMLWGGAHTNAVLAAIGGGTLSAGGYGVCGGIQVLLQYAWAAGAYYEYQRRLATQWL